MLNFLNEMFTAFAKLLLKVLPTSPFHDYIVEFSSFEGLAVLNWFFPVRACVKIGSAWLACITVYYVYSIVMRWVKMID